MNLKFSELILIALKSAEVHDANIVLHMSV